LSATDTQFKQQGLDIADKVGIPKVAQDFGLAESMLYLRKYAKT
jgi:hypothetical protein